MGDHTEVTALLARMNSGDSEALPKLIERMYPELRRLAGHYMRGERSNHTLQPTALINEAYLKLAEGEQRHLHDRKHFIAVAARIMRSVLVDHARKHRAGKRGGGLPPLELKEVLVYAPLSATELLALEDVLARYEAIDPVKARILELKIFGDLSVQEIAEVLSISESTVKRYWSAAHARLKRDLSKLRKA